MASCIPKKRATCNSFRKKCKRNRLEQKLETIKKYKTAKYILLIYKNLEKKPICPICKKITQEDYQNTKFKFYSCPKHDFGYKITNYAQINYNPKINLFKKILEVIK